MGTQTDTGFELRFESLFVAGRGMSFPCDIRGTVDLNTMTERLRNNYLFARALVGREFKVPAVLPHALH